MQHVLGMIIQGSNVEILDDDDLSRPATKFMDLFSAMAEGDRRMKANPNIMKINVYEVLDGVRRSSPIGRYVPVHALVRQGFEG